jgi:hypothetical protein
MQEDLTRNYQRWREADVRGDDRESDQAFADVFKACVSEPLPSAAFTARTMSAIAAAGAADARRALLIRRALVWSGVPVACVAAYFAAGPLLSILSDAFVALLNLLVRFVVLLANGASLRSGAWSLLTAIGRAAAVLVTDPRVTVAMLVFQVVAVAALAALHRLLGPEREWSK